MFSYKFIFVSTLTFIPYTVLWFFWHNNLFHSLYYSVPSLYSMSEQNIWAMNFANALLVYGFVFFYFKSIKPGFSRTVLWGIYYNLSVVGFFSFMAVGMLRQWSFSILVHDLIWAVVGGAVSGSLCHLLFIKIPLSRS